MKFNVWIFLLLLLIFWPAAIVYAIICHFSKG